MYFGFPWGFLPGVAPDYAPSPGVIPTKNMKALAKRYAADVIRADLGLHELVNLTPEQVEFVVNELLDLAMDLELEAGADGQDAVIAARLSPIPISDERKPGESHVPK